jgi:tetratricopeptide (TPR) repeat protein
LIQGGCLKIDSTLKTFIKDGNVILFMGSGASLGAKKSDGFPMPTAYKLRDLIADKYLGGKNDWQDISLMETSEVAISQTDKVTVQKYIRDIFFDFKPCDFHYKIPKYSWSGIYTTNYDLIIEDVYKSTEKCKQDLKPIHRTTDRVDSLIKNTQTDLAYTKLHGCINKIDEHDLPLILTADQYVTHKDGREQLFSRLVDQAACKPILFVGHSLNDPDIRQALHEISKITDSRPRCWALMYDFKPQMKSMWESKRISLIKGSFEDFMNSLETGITDLERDFSRRKAEHPLEAKFTSNDYSLTDEALRILDNPLLFIHNTMALDETCKPELFYHGYSNGWYPIQEELDIRRTLADEIVSDVVLAEESDKMSDVEVFQISGSAGSGKSVILKRIAHDAAIDYDRICLFWDSNERLETAVILEIAEKVGERIFLFVDKVSTHVGDLMHLISNFRRAKLPLTCFVAERSNVWNTECIALHKFLTDSFAVRKLSRKEISELLDKLEKYNCLGALSDLDRPKQMDAFTNRLDRQLLVALHEATMAKSFEDIIQDEYDNIADRKAQLIYRTVCTMNQFGVPVRAGIINRVHNVDFESFKKLFLSPLENVLHVSESGCDVMYEARHPTIAEMVFSHALSTDSERFNSYISLLQSLDIGYSPDRTAFRELIKFRHLQSVFSNLEDIEQIYKTSYKTCGNDDYYYQQFAIFYMRSRKNFKLAEKNLMLAQEYGRHNHSIKHTWSELELAKANKASGLERERLFNKAARLAREASRQSSDSYGHSTLCKISIKRLEDALNSNDEEVISDAADQAQEQLRTALLLHPDADTILELEAKMAILLKDDERATKALEKAFAINSSNSHLASALGGIYLLAGKVSKAIDVYDTVLLESHRDKVSHGKLASIYSTAPGYINNDKAEYHWHRSFTDGDSNIVNKVWYSRQLYINDKFEEYKTLLNRMRLIRIPPLTKNTIRGMLAENDKPLTLVGEIVKKDISYLLIESAGYKGTHFLHSSNCSEDDWDKYVLGGSIHYNLGFTAAGTAAKSISTHEQ